MSIFNIKFKYLGAYSVQLSGKGMSVCIQIILKHEYLANDWCESRSTLDMKGYGNARFEKFTCRSLSKRVFVMCPSPISVSLTQNVKE